MSQLSENRMNAFVTLITSDSYLPGAVNLAHSLLDVHGHSTLEDNLECDAEEAQSAREFMIVCLVTPSTVSYETILSLRNVFDLVVGVEEITGDADDLNVLGRPDLNAVLTKLHIFRLEQFRRIVYLDADTLVLRPIVHLFGFPSDALHAAPDAGWPDCFNSGVMVLTPKQQTFDDIVEMVQETGSFDGGDQGILNDFFPDWQRLSFSYNTTPTPAYTYAPAYRRYGASIHIVHFIGAAKPWLSPPPRHLISSSISDNSYESLVQTWYKSYYKHYPDQIENINKGGFHVPTLPPAWASASNPEHRGGMDLDNLRKIFMRGARRNYSQGGSWSSIAGANFVTLPGKPLLLQKAPPFSPEKVVEPIPEHQQNIEEVAIDFPISPPDPTSQYQMREPFNSRAENAWDSPSDFQTMFCPPRAYPPVPEHLLQEGSYDAVMNRSPSTSQFPWDKSTTRTATRVFPGDPPRQRATPSNSAHVSGTSSVNSESNLHSASPINSQERVKTKNMQGTYHNVWDADPAITAYLKIAQPPKGNTLGLRNSKAGSFDFHRAVEGQAIDEDGDDESEDQTEARGIIKHHTADKAMHHVHYKNLVRRVDTDSGSPVFDTTATISTVPLHSPTHESHLQHYEFEPTQSSSNVLAPPRSKRLEIVTSQPITTNSARVFSSKTDPEFLRTDTQETLLRFLSESAGSKQKS